jgi:hypothetical protein
MHQPSSAPGAAVSRRNPTWRGWLLASPVLAIAFVPLVANWEAASRRGDTTTRDFAHDLLNSVEPYGILVTAGDNDTFPLWYAQQVEGIRKDVVIAVTELLNTDWYARQLVRNPVHAYDEAHGPAIYRDRHWPKPTVPPVRMTLDEVDQVPPFVRLPEPQRFQAGDIDAEVAPGILEKADILVLRMIKDNTGRPIYFSRTTGGYADRLGLSPYLLTQGFARKLLPNVPSPGRDTLLVPGEGFVDLQRSVSLWTDVFRGQRALIAKDGWPDRASINIPVLYVVTGALLGNLLDSGGNRGEAKEISDTSERIVDATRMRDIFPTLPRTSSPIDSPPIDSPPNDSPRSTIVPAPSRPN